MDSSTEYARARRHDRTGEHVRALLERKAELAVLTDCLAAARRGEGSSVFIEAPAGRGKSRLLGAAAALAHQAGMRVLRARGAELEHEFPFGLAIQLFEAELRDGEAGARPHLLEGPARRISDLMDGLATEAEALPRERGYARIHGLFWLARNLAVPARVEAEAWPVAMIVDDLHWSDWPSLRFLAYLAERLAGLPIALIMAARTGEPSFDSRAIAALRKAADECVLRPGLLTPRAVGKLVRAAFPDAAESFVEACARATKGNPFLLVELLEEVRRRDLRPNEHTASRLTELTPAAVLDRVAFRLGEMPPEASALASAVAVLGDDAPLQQAALVADLDIDTTLRAADALAARHLFHSGTPLGFVHPLVRASVHASISDLRRGEIHRRAAAVLSREGAPEEQIATHLLAAPPEGNPRSVEVLRAAARKALNGGAPAMAARMLERALHEGPERAVYPHVLAELGHAELAAGLPKAIQRLEEAVRVTEERPRRAQLALTHGRALHRSGRHEEAAAVFAAALAERDAADRGIADELEAAFITTATFVPSLRQRAHALGEDLLARVGRAPSAAQRIAIAHLAIQDSLRDANRVTVVQRAELAWSDRALLDAEAPERPVWPLLAGSLLFVDELERSLAICDAAARAASGSTSAGAPAAASYCRAWSLYHQGRVDDALVEAQAAVAAGSEGWHEGGLSAYGALAACQLQRGELDHAERTLSVIDQPAAVEDEELPVLLDVRAQLRLAQLRPRDALSDATEAGRRYLLARGDVSPGVLAWRSTAALAHLALGEADAATRLAHDELKRARASDVTRVAIRDLRVLGLAARGRERIDLLEQAVSEGEDYPTRLEHIHALVELGGALRRGNRRADARGPLRRGLELAHEGGSRLLTDQARRELNATGARPRRAMLTGPDALTPSERRVAELAVEGLTTRQISEALYVSPKTVEFHLRHIYRKLDVSSSRRELARVLRSTPVEHPLNTS